LRGIGREATAGSGPSNEPRSGHERGSQRQNPRHWRRVFQRGTPLCPNLSQAANCVVVHNAAADPVPGGPASSSSMTATPTRIVTLTWEGRQFICRNWASTETFRVPTSHDEARESVGELRGRCLLAYSNLNVSASDQNQRPRPYQPPPPSKATTRTMMRIVVKSMHFSPVGAFAATAAQDEQSISHDWHSTHITAQHAGPP
jgi:hypothetical protein